MELKTLKDLSWDYDGILFDRKVKIISEDKLKAEAVKWVKHMDSMGEPYASLSFINFFNLTSEELR